MRKILYVSPLLPSTSGNGGRRACYNHLLELSKCDVSIDAVFIDVEETNNALPDFPGNVNFKVFKRAAPKLSANISVILANFYNFFKNRLPRPLSVVCSDEAVAHLKYLNSLSRYDFVIVDHLNAYGIVKKSAINIDLIYFAHNLEANLLREHVSYYPKFSVAKILRGIDLRLLRNIEFEILNKSKKIICISSDDASALKFYDCRHKVECWPELPIRKNHSWSYSKSKKMVFVGSAKYFPNKEAIEWLVNYAMPYINQKDPNIILLIVGTSKHEIFDNVHSSSVEFLGYVSDDQLEKIQLESDMFFCPVILGGGVKIKLLEATAYGLPVAATFESLRGIDYLNGNAILINRNDLKSLNLLIDSINSPDFLNSMSKNTIENLDRARKSRSNLLDLFIH